MDADDFSLTFADPDTGVEHTYLPVRTDIAQQLRVTLNAVDWDTLGAIVWDPVEAVNWLATGGSISREPGTYSRTALWTVPQTAWTWNVLCTASDAAIWGPQGDDPNVNKNASFPFVKVISLVWEKYDFPDNLPLEAYGGGLRIFPGKLFNYDPNPYPRARVYAKATVYPAIEGVPVYFKLWDVDDPSDDSGVVDDDTTGPNNWGYGALVNEVVLTDPLGVARAILNVSYQPGDNYRVAAACYSATLGNMTQAQADAGNHPRDGKTTAEVLTVWRKLWVEFDDMAPAPSCQKFGTVWGAFGSVIGNTLAGISASLGDYDCLKGAVLNPNGTQAPASVNYVGQQTWEVESQTPNTLTVTGDYTYDGINNDQDTITDGPSEVYDLIATAPNLFAANTDDAPWKDGVEPLDPASTVSSLASFFSPAFILPVVLPSESNATSTFPFVRNTTSNWPVVDVLGGSTFWTVCLGSAYEGPGKALLYYEPMPDAGEPQRFYAGDNDPTDEGVSFGAYESAGTLQGYTREDGSCYSRQEANVYLEAIRDVQNTGKIAKICAHEIGHMLGLEHAQPVLERDQSGNITGVTFPTATTGLMGYERPGLEMTTWDWRAYSPPRPDYFSPWDIQNMRAIWSDG